MSEVAKDGVEVAEQEQQKSNNEQDEAKPEVKEPEKDEKPQAASNEDEKEDENEGAAEGGKEEPEVKEKPQQSDPEEPDDDVPIVLVTGASGYVATHIIKQLLEQARFRVRGTVRNLDNDQKVKPLRELVEEPKYPLRLIEADLQNSKSWIEAVRRCRYVFHVASPFPAKVPKNADVLIKPAVEGTTNVLRACAESGTVKRVILTSSVAAVSCGMLGTPGKPQDHVYTEADWSDEKTCPPYERSKLKAEQAAVEFVKNLAEGQQIELVAVCPGFVQGPILSASSGGTSIDFCCNLLKHGMSRIPDINMALIDVRDAAAAHIAAMEKPEAAGNRYLLVGNETIPMKQIAHILETEFKPQGYKVPVKGLPKAGVWLVKFVNSDAKALYPMVGKRCTWSNEKMKGELGVQPRPVEETVIDMGYSVIERGLVAKKKGYLGHPSTRPPPSEPAKEEPPSESTKEEPQKEPQTEPAKEEPKTEPAKVETVSEPAKEEPTSESTKEEPVSEPAKNESVSEPAKDEPVSELPKDEPVSEPPKDEPVSEPPKDEPVSEPPKEDEPISEPVKEDEPVSEPAKEEPVSEPPKEDEPVSEPVKEDEPVSEPAKEDEPVSEPPKDDDPVSEPPKEDEPISEPAKEASPSGDQTVEEPSEPANTVTSSEEAKDEASESPQQDQEPDQSEGT